MANIFLDTNIFVDLAGRIPNQKLEESLLDYKVYLSPLSVHIYCYAYKIKIPDINIQNILKI